MIPLRIAFTTLTLLPIAVARTSANDLKRSVIFYPLVGGAIGSLFLVLHLLPLPSDLQALVILVAWVLVTGAFHLDGLGDCLDGWFGGRTVQERLRIMKAPNLGTYGMTAIILVLLSKYVLLVHLLGKSGPELFEGKDLAIYWLLATPAIARWGVCLACRWAKVPTGNQGLGSQVLGISDAGFLLATLLAIAFGMPLKWPLLTVFGVTTGISFGTILLSRSRIGGLTGDGLGSIIELSEVGILFVGCLSYA
jgi:adenosylcobinamide-GDP ribazoletransferase